MTRCECAVRLAPAVMAVLLLTGCHDAAPPPDIRAALTADPPAPGTGACEFDLSESKVEAVFYVLGMLDDYNGRGIVDDGDHVERFYCEELAVAEEFRAALVRVEQDQQLAPALQGREQECLTSFRSKETAGRLNSCYQYDFTNQMTVPAPEGTGRRRVTSGRFNFGLLYDQTATSGSRYERVDRRRALAYLAGAWRRYGREGRFGFANAPHKAEGIAQVLVALGCTDVSVEYTVGAIPGHWRVTFTPTEEVARRLSAAGPVIAGVVRPR